MAVMRPRPLLDRPPPRIIQFRCCTGCISSQKSPVCSMFPSGSCRPPRRHTETGPLAGPGFFRGMRIVARPEMAFASSYICLENRARTSWAGSGIRAPRPPAAIPRSQMGVRSQPTARTRLRQAGPPGRHDHGKIRVKLKKTGLGTSMTASRCNRLCAADCQKAPKNVVF